MSFTTGSSLKFSIFGSSHGNGIGGSLEGFPAGFRLDKERIKLWADRRKPGSSVYTSQRKEDDTIRIVSGFTGDYTDGSPITIFIENKDSISKHYDYLRDNPRPGHGDITLFYKYGKYRNYQGGGFLSGRMTAPLVALGSIALDLLKEKFGIEIISWIDNMGGLYFGEKIPEGSEEPYKFETRCENPESERLSKDILKEVLSRGDSVGAGIRTVVRDVPKGLGEPFFDSVESSLSKMLFSIPGLKGVEFGSGFRFQGMRGSEANDLFYIDGGIIKTRTNNNGGVLGGITNGMPLDFRVVMKPTSSIHIEQKTVNIEKMEESTLKVTGRHDPCIAIRSVPVVQCSTAITLLDLMIQAQKVGRVLKN
ncbi:chorismate synthase [Oxyplasma meridianum]|uniref:Chorismate synthase n=1 Tax=Oxyplasma meridianum TaxID=3073602 RepID=A0AAX4NE84_9ARCH